VVNRAWGERARVLSAALERDDHVQASIPKWIRAPELPQVLGGIINGTIPEEVWLTLSVMTGSFPTDEEVEEIARESEFDGGRSLAERVRRTTTKRRARRTVRVAGANEILIDVSTTVSVEYLTGIQRVVRETASRWSLRDGAVLVAWTKDWRALRALTPAQNASVVEWGAGPAMISKPVADPNALIVPWKGTVLTPELPAEVERTSRWRSLAQYARCRTGVIVFDCVPITSSETRIDWQEDTFSHYLAALSHCDVLAPISDAAATEFRGWRSSLAAIGRRGPAIEPIQLPAAVAPPRETDIEAARERFLVRNLPMVLVVGSREPRKNHAAVLHAAELLWRRGHEFSLTFVGGRAWQADVFTQQLQQLQQIGRLVDVAAGAGDTELAAAYSLARFSVFPSLNEGFGLPVAESLALGTPVITSNFGSMREIAEGGGALMVDPRSDDAIADAMALLLTDEILLAQLRTEARARPKRTWDDYASETWDLLVERQGDGEPSALRSGA
jgi:glycosyltransferase involved in cell wall biosynthesis